MEKKDIEIEIDETIEKKGGGGGKKKKNFQVNSRDSPAFPQLYSNISIPIYSEAIPSLYRTTCFQGAPR